MCVMPVKTLGDAALDRRVAMADARDAYRKTVTRARVQLKRDYARADAGWIIAANQVRAAAVKRRSMRARFREMSVETLQAQLSQLAYMLTPQYAQYTNPAERNNVQIIVGMITGELTRRGEL